MIKNVKNSEMPWKNLIIYEDKTVHERTKKVKKIDIRKQSELCLNRIDTTNSE